MYASVIYYFLFVSSLGIHYYSYSFLLSFPERTASYLLSIPCSCPFLSLSLFLLLGNIRIGFFLPIRYSHKERQMGKWLHILSIYPCLLTCCWLLTRGSSTLSWKDRRVNSNRKYTGNGWCLKVTTCWTQSAPAISLHFVLMGPLGPQGSGSPQY